MENRSEHNQVFLKALKRLNINQRRAVDTIEGPVLVVAGPGTGKTQILAARIGNILHHSDAQPHNILCLTFTDAAVIAMRERLVQFIGPEAYNVHIHTFHSFCNKVIQENPEYFGMRELQAISDLEQAELFKQLLDNLATEHPLKRFTGKVYYETSRMRDLFSTLKREGWSPEFIIKKAHEYLEELPLREEYQYKRANAKKNIKAGDPKVNDINKEKAKIDLLIAALNEFENFQELMLQNERYDFDDMISWVVKAFEEHEELLRRYQEQYLYFLVDEFQDTNGSQNFILEKLSGFWDIPNLFVVGDDDQSIYRFQGASVSNIFEFYAKYKEDLQYVVLDENYRSSQKILDASASVIVNNNERLVNIIPNLIKDLTAKGEYATIETDVKILSFDNILQEEAHLVDKITKLYEAGQRLSDYAIIYRNHRQVEDIVKVLTLKKIPLNVKERINILDLPFIKKVIKILQYIQVEQRRPGTGTYLLFEILHFDFFDVHHQDILKISYEARQQDRDTDIVWREIMSSKERMFQLHILSASAIYKLGENLSYWTKNVTDHTIQTLLEKIVTHGGILEYIMKSNNKTWLMQVLSSFFEFIKKEHAQNPSLTIKDLLSLIDRMTENNIKMPVDKVITSQDGIHFITGHSSKGLEFNHVYILGANADNWEAKRKSNRGYKLPDNLNRTDIGDQIEEERRLFFVAMTRAKKTLQIGYANAKNEGKPIDKSRFIAEIMEERNDEIQQVELPEEVIVDYKMNQMSGEGEPELHYIDHEMVDRALKTFKISVTSLNKYIRCPISFYFENLLKVPSARSESSGFGSAIHYALENYFIEMKQSEDQQFPGKDRMLELFEKGMEKYKSHFTDEQYDRRLEYGKMLFPKYLEKYESDWNKVTVLEYDVANAQVKGVPITGKLDKMEFFGNDIHVVDYKTGKPERAASKMKEPSEKEPNGGEYWRQLVFYKILLDADKTKRYNMVSAELDFIQMNADHDFDKQKLTIQLKDIDLVKKLIVDTHQKIHAHELEKGCGEEYCQWCNFVKFNFDAEKSKLKLTEEE